MHHSVQNEDSILEAMETHQTRGTEGEMLNLLEAIKRKECHKLDS